jgi:enoyl-CoA hydratase
VSDDEPAPAAATPRSTIDPRSERSGDEGPLVRLEHGPVPHVAEIVLSRPAKLNAWSWSATNELCAVAEEVRFDPDVRAVVLRAEGRAFCAGEDLRPARHDVHERHAGRSPAEVVRNSYERARYLFERWQVLTDLPQPVVAGIQGWCLGAGLELAMLADLRIAASDAVFGLPQTTIGVPVVGGADLRLAIECGPAVAKLLAFTGERFDADRAAALGVVQRVVAPDELLGAVRDLAGRIAANAPIAVQSVKRSVDGWSRRGFLDVARFEALSSSVAFASTDLYEGFAAAAERRPAEFRGH